MKEVILTNGGIVFVDDEDFEKVNKFKWYSVEGRYTKYARRTTSPYVLMHSFILGTTEDIDHKNKNGLDNCRSNIRLAGSDNNKNVKMYKSNKVGFKGVHFAKDRKRIKPYRAMICINGKNKSLGYYKTPEEAAAAYDKAAKMHFGEFCGELNFE